MQQQQDSGSAWLLTLWSAHLGAGLLGLGPREQSRRQGGLSAVCPWSLPVLGNAGFTMAKVGALCWLCSDSAEQCSSGRGRSSWTWDPGGGGLLILGLSLQTVPWVTQPPELGWAELRFELNSCLMSSWPSTPPCGEEILLQLPWLPGTAPSTSKTGPLASGISETVACS